jgi:heparosan-N-sulfate-glucuronate 5-epimerase
LQFETAEERCLLSADLLPVELKDVPVETVPAEIKWLQTISAADASGVAQGVPIRLQSPWQNPARSLDVNGDGLITPRDALIQLNWLNDRGAGSLPRLDTAFPQEGRWVDVNGDGLLTPLDVLLVAVWLGRELPLPAVGFDVPSLQGMEATETVHLPVSLSAAWNEPVTVHYAVTGGTARGQGLNYKLADGVLTFAPCQTRASIAVSIFDNSVVEADLTIRVTLSDPRGATLGDRHVCAYTILNNDVYTPLGLYLNYHQIGPITDSDLVRLDPQGIPMLNVAGKYIYSPVNVAEYGLQQYSYFIGTGNASGLVNAISVADWLVDHQDPANGKWYYNVDFPVGAMDVTLISPWSSAMAQGYAMSLLTRVYSQTGDAAYLASATAALAALEINVDQGGLAVDFHGHVYFEEYPTTPPSFTLNGFLFTLLGLYDLSQQSPASPAAAMFRAGLETVKYALPYYDTKDVSAYHLGHLTNPPRPVHADLYYHYLHAQLLQALNSLAPDNTLAHYSAQWAAYLPPAASPV